jgi:hypothetical protein
VAPLNGALIALIRRLRDTGPNEAPGSSTYGGYQTDTNFLTRGGAVSPPASTAGGYLPRYFQNDRCTAEGRRRRPKAVIARWRPHDTA